MHSILMKFCFLMLVTCLLGAALDEICQHTLPNENGHQVILYKDFHCCGCNAGEYTKTLCSRGNVSSTVCKSCPFEDDNPNIQGYMPQGPHLNTTCIQSLVSCPEGLTRINGNRTTPASCVKIPPEKGIPFPWDVILVTFFVACFCRSCGCFIWKKFGKETTRESHGSNPRESVSAAEDGEQRSLVNRQNSFTMAVGEAVCDTGFNTNQETDDQHAFCDSENSVNANKALPMETFQKELMTNIKQALSEKMDEEDSLKFFRNFGLTTRYIDEVKSQSFEERFIRRFEMCEKNKSGEISEFTATKVLDYFKRKDLTKYRTIVENAMN